MRTAPAVLAAVITVVVVQLAMSLARYLALLAGIPSLLSAFLLPTSLSWPIRPGVQPLAVGTFVVALAAWVGMVALATWLGCRGARSGAGGWPVGLSAWLGASAGGLIAGFISQVALISTLPPAVRRSDTYLQMLLSNGTAGAYAGLASGWIVALAAAVVFARTNRHQPRSEP